jgi:hypothetical protein
MPPAQFEKDVINHDVRVAIQMLPGAMLFL